MATEGSDLKWSGDDWEINDNEYEEYIYKNILNKIKTELQNTQSNVQKIMFLL